MPNFGTEIQRSNIEENWLFHFASSGTDLYLAFSDVTDSSQFYHGVVLNSPSIRESLNLERSTARTSNISVSIPDFNYNGSPVSETLLFGSAYFLNQVATVYSKIGDQTKVQIGVFRLTDISTNGSTIALSLTAHLPTDNITIPQAKTIRNNYFPVVYGDYTSNTSTVSSPDFCNSKDLYPTPVERVENSSFIALQTKDSSGGKCHFYDKSADIFVPLDDANNNSVTWGSGFANKTDIDLHRSYRLRPNSIIATDQYADYDDNGANTVDNSDTTKSTLTYTLSQGTLSNSNRSFSLSRAFNAAIPQVQHEVQEYKTGFTFDFTLNVEAIASSGHTIQIGVAVSDFTTGSYADVKAFNYVATFGSTGQFDLTSGNLTLTSGDQTGSGIISQVKGTHLSSDFITNVDGLATDQIKYKVVVLLILTSVSGNQITDMDLSFKMYDTFVQPVLKIPVRDDDVAKHNSASESIASINTLYSGSNGLVDNGWNSNAAITEIHEIHRDLLSRFAGLSNSDPSGWSNLNSDKDWRGRYWLTEPVPLIEVLEKLQYEGGFIYSHNKGYIHIRDSESADIELTKNDISDIQISHTPFSQLKTKYNINYRKHPAENRYLTSVTSSNSTTRTNYNIASAENTTEVNLDAYVGDTSSENDIPTTATSGNNDDWFSYYNNIFGTVKAIISATIVNPKFYNHDDNNDLLGIGSKVTFSSMHPEKIFGKDFDDVIFIITEFNRSVGKIKFKAREIA